MTKRLIEIDDELLDMARELADAETIRGTVEEALRRLVRIESTKRHIEELSESLEPNAVELIEEARRVDPPPGGFPD
ncbi:MAG: type II toxin-antitoxin system VapB family antitoxin [Acidimicrobiia bacterium]